MLSRHARVLVISFLVAVLGASLIAYGVSYSAGSFTYDFLLSNSSLNWLGYDSVRSYGFALASSALGWSGTNSSKGYAFLLSRSSLGWSGYDSVSKYLFSKSLGDYYLIYNGTVVKDNAVVASPDAGWFNCSFLYRRPYLFYFNSSASSTAYLVFDDSSDVYGNVTSSNGLLPVVANSTYSAMPDFNWSRVRKSSYIKVGIKPSSFGGSGTYVMIEVNGSWIDPVDGSVEAGSSGQIINASFSLDPSKVWVIQAVGLYHTGGGYSDPTEVYVWDSEGNLLHQYQAGSHTWDDSIYGHGDYFEYVTIDNYAVPQDVLVGGYEIKLSFDLSGLTNGYYYIYVYYGGGSTLNLVKNVSSDFSLSSFSDYSEGGMQLRPDSCLETTSSTTTTSNYYSGGGGAPAPQPAPTITSSSEPIVSPAPDEPATSNTNVKTVVIPLVGTITVPKFGWIVSSRGSSTSRILLLTLGLTGLLLLYISFRPVQRRRRR